MKLRIEARVGIIGILTILVLIWGINYLKGRNILNRTVTLYAFCQESGGLESSAPVTLNGVKIGYVDQVSLVGDGTPRVQLILKIEQAYQLGQGSVAELYSADLLGTKAISIVSTSSGETLNDQDTIPLRVAPDLVSRLQAGIFPLLNQVGSLSISLDSLVRGMDSLFVNGSLGQILENLAAVSGSLKSSLEPGGSLYGSLNNLDSLTGMLSDRRDEMASLISHLSAVSRQLDSAGLGQLAGNLRETSVQLNDLLSQVNSGKGTAGMFLYSDSLYLNLVELSSDLDLLVRDLKDHPKDYVHFSLFGKSDKQK
jgi:phospholipid/cholesterol/gamma-HCH transport system substrate-binding protein